MERRQGRIGIVRERFEIITFQGFIGPLELTDIGDGQIRARITVKGGKVAEIAARPVGQRHNSQQLIAGIDLHQGPVQRRPPRPIDIPVGDRPIAATSGIGVSPLQDRLKNERTERGLLDAVEEENRLAVVGRGRGGNDPPGAEITNGIAGVIGPLRVNDPAICDGRRSNDTLWSLGPFYAVDAFR
jgi:hypothetical protein